jgi:hypothetical protein
MTMQNNFYPLVIRGFLSTVLGTFGLLLNLRTDLISLYIIYQLNLIVPAITTVFLLQNSFALMLGLILYRFLQSALPAFLTYFRITFEKNHFIQDWLQIKSPSFLLISGLLGLSIGINLLTFSHLILTHLSMLNLPIVFTLAALFLSFGADRILTGIDLQMSSINFSQGRPPKKLTSETYNLKLDNRAYRAFHKGNELKIPFSELITHKNHVDPMIKWLFINSDFNHEKSNIGPFFRNTKIALITLVTCNVANHLFRQYSEFETDKAFIKNKKDLFDLQAILLNNPLYKCAKKFNVLTRTWLYFISSPISLRLHYINQYAKCHLSKEELKEFEARSNMTSVRSLFDFPLLNLVSYFAIGVLHISKKIAYKPCDLFYKKMMPLAHKQQIRSAEHTSAQNLTR